MSLFSTRVRFVKTRETSSTERSVTSHRSNATARECRSLSEAASPRRTSTISCRRLPGSTSFSGRTTWGLCRHSSSVPVITTRRRSKSSSRSTFSPQLFPPNANRPIPVGSRFPSGATTPARSASFRACAGRKWTVAPVMSSARSRPSSTTA